jgi:hypothetical protein
MALTGVTLSAVLTGTLTKTPASGLGDVLSQSLSRSNKLTFTDGGGANQVSKAWQSVGRSLAASTAENLDLSGTLADDFGTAVVFAEVKGIFVFAWATNGGNIQVGGHATAAFSTIFGDATDILILQPGGFFLLGTPSAAGYIVTATTADLLKVENMDGAAAGKYDIFIFGA